mgnify:FL=1|tara:strand:+ start:14763 stop:15077 length:315 start_codon:yes stop_codon:yes gene_type:complete
MNDVKLMREVFAEAGMALKNLREECQDLGEIVEGHYSVVWRGFYGCSYYRANYEEGITPCVILETYWDSSEEGSTRGFQSLGEAKEYIESEAAWLFENVFAERA